MKRPVLAILALALSATAAAQSVDAPKVVAPGKLASYWALLNDSVEADVPNIAKNINVPGCATVSFVVEKNGTTSQVKVQRVVPAGDLVRVAESMGKHLRFEPTVANAERSRVFSWLIFPFNAPADASARSAMMQPCAIERLEWKDR
ncbi:MAG: energy transducer TonB [Dokdonella sp.]|nr:energy transducer TonB [Dokdonella sp.]